MINPLFDPKTDNAAIADDTQARLNKPLAGGQLSADERAFLDQVLAYVDSGRINLYDAESLLNKEVHATLTPEAQDKAAQNAFLMLDKLRKMVDLERSSDDTNYQVKNLVQSVFQNKQRLESESGDIFII